VGRRSGLAIAGIGLPGHFVVKACDASEEILFDPFHGGRVLTPEDCEVLVQQVTGASFQADRDALTAIPLAQMVVRMLNNLKAIYLGRKDFPRGIRVMERLHQLEPANILQRRDLGVSYVQNDQPGKAIDHLQAYLHALPQTDDTDKVRALLRQAEKMVAGWN
jgi:regulator of sirC expression with transglutaminase-like and TPR domain